MKLPNTSAIALDSEELEELTTFAGALADAAASAILPYFRGRVDIEHKPGRGDFDPVTAADRAAESEMRDLISGRFPDHGIFGEEHGYFKGTTGLTWVLDPIDGTRAFISGIPLWGTLIALYNGERSVIGIADQPYLKERYVGNDRHSVLITPSGTTRLQSRKCSRLSEATLMSTSPEVFRTSDERAVFDMVVRGAKMTRYGGDCYAYCMLASGFVDVVVESGLQPYDIQALIPIIENAGGIVSNWQGSGNLQNGQVVAAGSRELLDEVVATLSQASLD